MNGTAQDPAVSDAGAPDAGGARPLDSFPFRHRVRSVMGTPPRFIDAAATVLAAAESMRALAIGSCWSKTARRGRRRHRDRARLGALARDGAAA
jgi:hypothetical protein